MKVEQILKKLVSFNTINDKENNEIINYIKEYLEKYNFICNTYGNDRKILIARTIKEPKLCFVGHTDTVESKASHKLEEIDGKLYGLGTCDMKGGIAAILKAVSEMDFNKLDYGIMLVFTYGEETDFSGIKLFVNEKINYPDIVIVGEPTDNIPMNGSKGAIEYHFEFYGEKTHSSRIKESSNINCVKFLNDLLELDNYFKERECSDYEFKHTTMNYGIIKGGEVVNMVSDYTFATCDFRIIHEEEYYYIKNRVDELSKKYNMKYKIGMDFLPFSNNSDLVNIYEKITNKKRVRCYGLSEASLLKGNRIVLGPGPITAHQDDEHITKESLYECVNNYKKIINYICK